MRILINILAIIWLSGCAQILPPQPDDPFYAPMAPVVEETGTVKPYTGSIFSQSNASYLYSDRKASRVGDLITVTLNESTNASKNADTEIKKENISNMIDPVIAGRTPTINGNPISFDISARRQFKAEADAKQANSLNGTITVTVAQVLPNGNLIIKGEKWLTLNHGNEFIRIAGIIRPEDISTDNTISSNRVANARITYSGTGSLNESNHIGWLARFFNSGWFPL